MAKKTTAARRAPNRGARRARRQEAGDHPHVSIGRRRLLPGELPARRPGRFPHPHRLRRAPGTDRRQPAHQGHGAGSQENNQRQDRRGGRNTRASGPPFGISRGPESARRGCAGEIWAAWTEDEDDAFAKSLRTGKDKALTALYGARTRMQLAGVTEQEQPARLAARLLRRRVRPQAQGFRRRAQVAVQADQVSPAGRSADRDRRRPGAGVRSRAAAQEGAARPVRSEQEGYGPDLQFRRLHGPARTGGAGARQRTGRAVRRSLFAAAGGHQGPDVLQAALLGRHQRREAGERIDNTQDWRRIDADWMGVATTLAMQLDQDTNNTSLVLAFELGPRRRAGRSCCSRRMPRSATGCPGRT